jgi:hypothetical protein
MRRRKSQSSLARRGSKPFGVESKAGRQEGSTQEGPQNIGRFWPGASVSIARPDGSKETVILRVVASVGQSGSSQEGAVRSEATPELVSQDRERVRLAFGLSGPGYEHRQILRSAQWGLAAMPAPISVWECRDGRGSRGDQPPNCRKFHDDAGELLSPEGRCRKRIDHVRGGPVSGNGAVCVLAYPPRWGGSGI